jgi:membrane protein DedA with SNARE-associated domain
MSLTYLTEFFAKYGMITIFVVVLLENMNFPGFPSGVIMPFSGMMAAQGKVSFPMVLLVTCLAGLCGSWILYLLGWKGGGKLLKAYQKRFPKQKPTIDKNLTWLRQKGCFAVFVAKLLPVVRTIISLPAGTIRLNVCKYLFSSLAGIFIWNLVFTGAGYFLGTKAIELLG